VFDPTRDDNEAVVAASGGLLLSAQRSSTGRSEEGIGPGEGQPPTTVFGTSCLALGGRGLVLRVSHVSLTDRQTNPPRKVGSDTIVSNAVPNSQ